MKQTKSTKASEIKFRGITDDGRIVYGGFSVHATGKILQTQDEISLAGKVIKIELEQTKSTKAKWEKEIKILDNIKDRLNMNSTWDINTFKMIEDAVLYVIAQTEQEVKEKIEGLIECPDCKKKVFNKNKSGSIFCDCFK